MGTNRTGRVGILLVEDNPADVLLTQQSFRASRVANQVEVVGNGEAALRFLRRQTPYRDAQRPDLVVLDLNLPAIDGREVLAQIKADPDLQSIPIVVLTSSTDPMDVQRAYELRANCYLTKPMSLHEYAAVLKAIDEFWLGSVELPP